MNEISSQEAVAAVEKWLKVSKQVKDPAPAVVELIGDLKSNQNTKEWSKVNFERLIPFRIESPVLLQIVRAGFLFLPILLTWLALSQVIGPFALFLQNKQASANFLWFWQQNPDKSFSDLWVLSHVALTDAAVLAFLLVLAMRITWWENARTEQLESAYGKMLSALERFFSTARDN